MKPSKPTCNVATLIERYVTDVHETADHAPSEVDTAWPRSYPICINGRRGGRMTDASRAIERLISYRWNHWVVGMDEQRAALGVLRTDPDLPATIRDLNAAGMIPAVVNRLPTYEVTQLLGGACDASLKGSIRSAIIAAEVQASGGSMPGALGGEYDVPWLFDLSFDIQNGFRRIGAHFTVTPFNETSFAALIPRAPDAPFSGTAATGITGVSLHVPAVDQALMLAGDRETTRRYTNPIPGDLFAYLASLPAGARAQQASLLLSRPISSLVPYSYASRQPSRAAVISLAATQYSLHPAHVTAFILAEGRDQSQNEDAKDLAAARAPVVEANTSIGLGQIVISTARREDLFSDLLSPPFRSSASHNQIAVLLTSDEINIFGVAKYVRTVANQGAGLSIGSLPIPVPHFLMSILVSLPPTREVGLTTIFAFWACTTRHAHGLTTFVQLAGVSLCSRRIAMCDPPVCFPDA